MTSPFRRPSQSPPKAVRQPAQPGGTPPLSGGSRPAAAEQGQSLVEFALVLPLLLIVLTGIFSFGIALNQYMVLTNATNASARAFALARGQTTPALAASDPCAYALSIARQAAPNLASSSLSMSIVYTTAAGAATTYNNAPTCPDISLNPLDTVQVTASYSVTPLMFGGSGRSLTMRAQSAEMMQ